MARAYLAVNDEFEQDVDLGGVYLVAAPDESFSRITELPGAQIALTRLQWLLVLCQLWFGRNDQEIAQIRVVCPMEQNAPYLCMVHQNTLTLRYRNSLNTILTAHQLHLQTVLGSILLNILGWWHVVLPIEFRKLLKLHLMHVELG